VPRRVLFEAVQSGARTAQIGRAAVIFQKNPSVFRKSTCAPEALSVYFAKNTSDYFEINLQSRRRALAAGQTRRPPLLPSFLPRASPCLQRLLRPSLAPHFSPLGIVSRPCPTAPPAPSRRGRPLQQTAQAPRLTALPRSRLAAPATLPNAAAPPGQPLRQRQQVQQAATRPAACLCTR